MAMSRYWALLPCVMLHTLANMFNHYILPQLLPTLICEDRGAHDAEGIHSCRRDPEVSGESSLLVGYCNLATTIASLCVLGIYGYVADKYGCKTAMMFPMLGITLFNGAILLCTIEPFSHWFRYLIPTGALLQGLLGGKNTFMMSIFAYTSEVTDAEHRGFAFSMLEACTSLAKTIGPAMLGALIINENFILPLWISVVFMGVFVAWTLLFVSAEPIESHVTNFKPGATSALQVLGTLCATIKDTLKLLGIPTQLGTILIMYAAFSTFFHHMASVGEFAIDILYFKSHFHWTAQMIGWFGTVTRAVEVVSMLAIPAVLAFVSNNRLDDLKFVQFGLAARAIFLVVLGSLPEGKGSYMYFVVPVLVFCGPITPRMRSFMSRQARPTEQAELFVGLAVVDSAASIGSMLFSWGYAATVKEYPGAMFQVLACVSLVSLVCLVVGSVRYPELVNVDYMYSEIGTDGCADEGQTTSNDTPKYALVARDSDLRGGLEAELFSKQLMQEHDRDKGDLEMCAQANCCVGGRGAVMSDSSVVTEGGEAKYDSYQNSREISSSESLCSINTDSSRNVGLPIARLAYPQKE